MHLPRWAAHAGPLRCTPATGLPRPAGSPPAPCAPRSAQLVRCTDAAGLPGPAANSYFLHAQRFSYLRRTPAGDLPCSGTCSPRLLCPALLDHLMQVAQLEELAKPASLCCAPVACLKCLRALWDRAAQAEQLHVSACSSIHGNSISVCITMTQSAAISCQRIRVLLCWAMPPGDRRHFTGFCSVWRPGRLSLAAEPASGAPEGLHGLSPMRALAADHLMQQHAEAAQEQGPLSEISRQSRIADKCSALRQQAGMRQTFTKFMRCQEVLHALAPEHIKRPWVGQPLFPHLQDLGRHVCACPWKHIILISSMSQTDII